MRTLFPLALVAATVISSVSYGYGLFDLLGLRCGDNAGCGCGSGCEPGCGCEPSCGCGSCGGIDGRQFGGQSWDCCTPAHVPVCECTGPDGSCQSGCSNHCCDGCTPAYGCASSCGCEPTCGCGDPCGCDQSECCLDGLCFGSGCGRLLGLINRMCGCNSCNGCSGVVYWSEWHNDPPRCQDPCDCYGNWTGPGHRGNPAPYGYGAPYYVGGTPQAPYFVGGNVAPPVPPPVTSPPNPFRTPARPEIEDDATALPEGTSATRRSFAPTRRGQISRKPAVGPRAIYQR